MMQRDNWGWQARIGLFIVGIEAVPEAEWWAMAPPHVSLHAARITAPTPWAAWKKGAPGEVSANEVEPAEDLVRGCRQFAGMRLSAVVLAHTSSSVVGGPGWDEAVVTRLHLMLAAGTIVTTNGLDCLAALRASGIRRPFLVAPAWFTDAGIDAALRYFSGHGHPPADHLRFDPGRKWREVPPAQLYAEGMGFEQEVEALYAQIRAACPADADGVMIVGTGFRCVGILDALERDLRRPVVSANQASLWHCLRLSGVRTAIPGYGSLLLA